MDEIREFTVYGCPYCIGPVYFTYDDAEEHMDTKHGKLPTAATL